MKLAVPLSLIVGVGCGSRPKPEPVAPVDEPKRVTRVPIEDESEDAPEEGVTFVKTKGSITKEAIESGLAPHHQALAECYTTRVGKRRWLGGHVVLHWELDPDGSIASVKLPESNLGAWAIEQCMVEVARQASFGKPNGGKVDFTVPLDFSAKGSTQVWDEDKALRAVGGQLVSLDDCDDFEIEPKTAKTAKTAKKARKQPAKKQEPAEPEARPEKPPSNVVVTLYVGPGGKLQSVGFASPTTEVGQKWSACAEQAASAWRLPDPRGQIAKLAIKYRAE